MMAPVSLGWMWRQHSKLSVPSAALSRAAGASVRRPSKANCVYHVSLRKLAPPFPDIELWAFPADKGHYGAGGALVKIDGFDAIGGQLLEIIDA